MIVLQPPPGDKIHADLKQGRKTWKTDEKLRSFSVNEENVINLQCEID